HQRRGPRGRSQPVARHRRRTGAVPGHRRRDRRPGGRDRALPPARRCRGPQTPHGRRRAGAGGGRHLTLTLASGDLEAVFVPEAGMVGCSLRHRGEELLGQRGGLDAYVRERKTMGIPLLYPWANRVGQRRFVVAGREVVIDPDATPLRLDGNGLAMHGLLTAASGWQVVRHDRTVLAAAFDFAAQPALMAAFPFAHELTL